VSKAALDRVVKAAAWELGCGVFLFGCIHELGFG
jgi:hypothetical protein